MLTTIGDKILEIRPKQIIESNVIIDNDYLIPLNNKSNPHYKKITKSKPYEQSAKQPPRDTKATS